MDAFFSSLDGRLRVSGMVADSIMMGIVNSAMEDAYKKSCSKEGDLERLNEKSRFCELAIMQLEWCLKYLQEVVDSSIVDGACDRKQLLADLLETRDRIHNRLEETENAIAEKDLELARRKESELNLRLALQLKGEQVSYLHNALGVERVKNERVNELVSDNRMITYKMVDHVFSELECSLNQQLSKIRCKLEGGRKFLTNLMQKIRNCSVDVLKANTGYDMNNNGIKTLHELHDMAQFNLEIEDMVIDTDILKAEIGSSFEKVENSISLFKTKIEEQKWAWNVEKEVAHVIIRNFMKDIQCMHYPEPAFVHPLVIDRSWSDLMVDISILHHELQELVPRFDVLLSEGINEFKNPHNTLSRGNSGEKGDFEKIVYLRENDNCIDTIGKNDESIGNPSKVKNIGNADGQSKENSNGSVADLIRNHESIIRKKTQEINWLKCELSREKSRYLSPKDDKTFAAIKEMIVNAISRLENMERYKMKIVTSAYYDGSLEYRRDEDTILQNTSGHKTLNNESLICDEWKSKEHQFKMENQETKVICSLDKMLEKECSILYNHLVDTELCETIRQLKEEKAELEIKVVILEDIYKILFDNLLRKMYLASFDIEMEIKVREDIYRVILTEICMKCYNDRESHVINSFVKEDIDKIVLRTMAEDIVYNDNLKSERIMTSCCNMIQGGENLISIHASSIYDSSVLCDAVASVEEEIQDRNTNTLLISGSTGKQHCDIQVMIMPLENFLQVIADFEIIASEKIRGNNLRLQVLADQFMPITKQLNFVRKNELLYRKAFTRRCYDLQTAEEEVDLLGDQVDLLFGLITKVHKTLNYYLPILQHYSGITEIVHLIEEELDYL